MQMSGRGSSTGIWPQWMHGNSPRDLRNTWLVCLGNNNQMLMHQKLCQCNKVVLPNVLSLCFASSVPIYIASIPQHQPYPYVYLHLVSIATLTMNRWSQLYLQALPQLGPYAHLRLHLHAYLCLQSQEIFLHCYSCISITLSVLTPISPLLVSCSLSYIHRKHRLYKLLLWVSASYEDAMI